MVTFIQVAIALICGFTSGIAFMRWAAKRYRERYISCGYPMERCYRIREDAAKIAETMREDRSNEC